MWGMAARRTAAQGTMTRQSLGRGGAPATRSLVVQGMSQAKLQEQRNQLKQGEAGGWELQQQKPTRCKFEQQEHCSFEHTHVPLKMAILLIFPKNVCRNTPISQPAGKQIATSLHIISVLSLNWSWLGG